MSSDVENIKERLSIVDVISSYIKVEKAGINFKAKCPFHNEKTPSFMISPGRQAFYCFGCHEKGDVFTFVEKFEGLDFRGALETLAKRAGVELKNIGKRERPEEKERLYEIMEEAMRIYERDLGGEKDIKNYLGKRGLSAPSISKWKLGFAKEGWRNLHDELLGKGFKKEEMFEAGLIKKVEKEGQIKFYDTFRDRIMFPISDAGGRAIAFSGRAMKENDKTPKYLNSPETKLFHKSEVLYGFDVAKNFIRKLDYAVLVEGQMDLIMSHQAGVANTVASSGTALSELHLKKIQRLTNRVIIAYDSDAAGEKAADKAAELGLRAGMEVKIASLPEGEDPASVASKNPEKWKEALRQSEHFLDFALNRAVGRFSGKNLTREILKNVLPLGWLLQSEIERTMFAKKVADKLGINEEAVLADLQRAKKIKDLPENNYFSANFQKIPNLERTMAAFVFWEETQNKRGLKKKWREMGGKEKVDEILKNYENNRERLIFEAEMHGTETDPRKLVDDLIKRFETDFLKQKLKLAAESLDQKDISKEKEKKIKKEIENLQAKIKVLNN